MNYYKKYLKYKNKYIIAKKQFGGMLSGTVYEPQIKILTENPEEIIIIKNIYEELSNVITLKKIDLLTFLIENGASVTIEEQTKLINLSEKHIGNDPSLLEEFKSAIQKIKPIQKNNSEIKQVKPEKKSHVISTKSNQEVIINNTNGEILFILRDIYKCLLTAITNSAKDILIFLIEKGASINKDYDESLLAAAIKLKCSEDIIKLLINKNTDFKYKDIHGKLLLQLAIEAGCLINIIKLLINKSDINYKNSQGKFILEIAIESGCSLEVIELLINKGVNITNKNHYGYIDSILETAIKANCSYDIIKLLINKGANINYKNSQGETLLQIAIKAKCPENIILLLIDKYEIDGQLVELAINHDYSESIIISLANKCKNTKYINSENQTIIYQALIKNFSNNFIILLLFLNYELITLDYEFMKNNRQMLYRYLSIPNYKKQLLDTMQKANEIQQIMIEEINDLMSILLKTYIESRKNEIMTRRKVHKTASQVHIPPKYKIIYNKLDINIVTMYLDLGADVKSLNYYNDTILGMVVKRKNLETNEAPDDTETVKLLIDRGSDINHKNKSGQSILDLAKKYNSQYIKLLQDHGAK